MCLCVVYDICVVVKGTDKMKGISCRMWEKGETKVTSEIPA